MNILYIDYEKYNMDESFEIFQQVRDILQDDLICLPTDTQLIVDVNLDSLRTIRDMIDKAIAEKESA